MSSAAASSFSPDSTVWPECFLPETETEAEGECGSGEEELVVDALPDGSSLPKVLAFRHEEPPQWKEVHSPRGVVEGRAQEPVRERDSQEEYASAFGEAKARLLGMVAGFEREQREIVQRADQLELSQETMRFHLEKMESVHTAGMSRARAIRELERGLVGLDAAEQDLEMELGRAGLQRGRLAGLGRTGAGKERWGRAKKRSGKQAFAFILPGLIFLVIALILLGTGLGWF